MVRRSRSRRKQRLSRRGGRRSFKSLFRRRNSKKRTRRNNNNSYNKPKKADVYEPFRYNVCGGYINRIYKLKTENNLLKKQVEILLNQQKENTSVSAYYNDNKLYY